MTVSILQVGTLNNKHHSTAGFTLFELLIVLAIMGMIMGMLVFNINFGSTSDDMKTAIRRISGAVSEARSRALLKRTPLELRVNGSTLELYQTIQNNRHRLGSAQLPANVIIEDIEIDGKHGRHVLLFQSRGITQPAIIRLASGDERQKILVRPILGIKLIDGKKNVQTD